MGTNTNIRSAIEQGIVAVSGFPAQRAYENVRFEPNTDTEWARITHIPGETRGVTLKGESVNRRYSGLFQVDLFYPSGNGPRDAEIVVDAILDAFKPGDTFTSNSTTVTISYSERNAAGESDEPWYRASVVISYYVFEA